jgi:hypothetical protein
MVEYGKPRQVRSAAKKWIKDKWNANVVLITKCLPLDLHMIKDLLVWYLKEHLLEVWQTPIHVSNPPKMRTTRDKTEPLGSQKVGPKNKQLKVTMLMYFVVPYGMGKC